MQKRDENTELVAELVHVGVANMKLLCGMANVNMSSKDKLLYYQVMKALPPEVIVALGCNHSFNFFVLIATLLRNKCGAIVLRTPLVKDKELEFDIMVSDIKKKYFLIFIFHLKIWLFMLNILIKILQQGLTKLKRITKLKVIKSP